MDSYDLDMLKEFFKFVGCTVLGVIGLMGLVFGFCVAGEELYFRIYGQQQVAAFNTTCKTNYTAAQYRFLDKELAQQVCNKANVRVSIK